MKNENGLYPNCYLKNFYIEKVIHTLKKKYSYDNIHQIPKLDKIVLNSAVKSELDKTSLQQILKDIESISGQKAVFRKAKRSISNFKLRKGMSIGVMVTLRRVTMYNFFYKLVNLSLPNIRDFRGVHNHLDGYGNYNLGIIDHTIFPEITMESGKRNIGLDISIVTTTSSDNEARELLRLLGMPFIKKK